MAEMQTASGEFEVNLQPLPAYAAGAAGAQLGRMSIDKQFQGDLQAGSVGEMLLARTTVAGSAAYVAIEQVSGSLNGRQGSFVLQHFGIMHAGGNRLILEVVPDSGSGELAGLTGTMQILNDGQTHRYVFEYRL